MIAQLSRSPSPAASACSIRRRWVSVKGRGNPASAPACNIKRTSYRCCESFAWTVKSRATIFRPFTSIARE